MYPATETCIHSSSGSTTRQILFPQFWHFPRRIRSLPSISALLRRIVTEPRHLAQKTLSRILFWAHSGIFSHRHLASGVKGSLGRISRIIFLFQPKTNYTVCIKRKKCSLYILLAPSFLSNQKQYFGTRNCVSTGPTNDWQAHEGHVFSSGHVPYISS